MHRHQYRGVIVHVIILILLGVQTRILAEGDGYGENPGGAGGDTVIVDNAQDFKTFAGLSQPYVIFISGIIDVGSEVKISSFKTISGIDPASTVIGTIGIKSGANNVVVKNLNITNPMNDGITIRNAKYVYVTNCTVYDCGDGAIDITVESDFVTISHCRFYYEAVTVHKFVNLIGADDNDLSDRGKLHVTMHDNWWDTGCTSRMPRVRFGYVHVYNNYFSCVDNNYCTRAGKEGHIVSEYNYFEGVRDPLTVDGGWIKSEGNEYVNCTGTIYAGTDDVFTPSYLYAPLDPADARDSILLKAGNTGQDPIPDDGKQETIINWTDQEPILYGAPLTAMQLNATAVGNTGTPVYSYGIGTILPEGYQTITVTFPEDANYRAASKTVNIKVNYEYYALSISAINGTGADLISVSPEGIMIDGVRSYPSGAVVTLTAASNLLSIFEHWQNGVTGNSISVSMDQDAEIIAYYQPVGYIAAWDFFDEGNQDRIADFYSSDENQTATLQVRTEDGTSTTWFPYSQTNTLLGKNAAMIRRSPSSVGDYYFQINFDATNFENIRIDASMLGVNTFYQIQDIEYSVDGALFQKVGAFILEQDSTWYSGTFPLPEEADRNNNVFVRFKADTNSNLNQNGVTGTSISEIRVLADHADVTGVDAPEKELKIIEEQFFSLDGKQLRAPVNGINIVLFRFEDGSISAKRSL